MSKYADLIARLEKATEGSRELDAEIAKTVGWIDVDFHRRGYVNLMGVMPGGKTRAIRIVPRWTQSLDAALTLVPDGCAFSVGCEIDFTPVARVFGHDIHVDEFADTPALALCIAALKARAASEA